MKVTPPLDGAHADALAGPTSVVASQAVADHQASPTSHTAAVITYDPASSWLVEDDVQAAIDELAGAPIGLSIIIDGGGSVITTGVKADVEIPFAATLTAARLFSPQVGDIVIDLWADSYANFPPDVADTIIDTGAGGVKPTLSGASHSEDATLAHWTTALAAGDILRVNVDSVATLSLVTLALRLVRT